MRQSRLSVITAINTSVLLDVLGADPTFGVRSKAALRACLREGPVVACEVVWAEVAGFFPPPESAQAAMEELGIAFSALDQGAALTAGTAWKQYRKRSGTRDCGFYRTYFRTLPIRDASLE